MQTDLISLDIAELEDLYGQENHRLRSLLQTGSTWKEIKQQQQRLTDIAIAVHHKKMTDEDQIQPGASGSTTKEQI